MSSPTPTAARPRPSRARAAGLVLLAGVLVLGGCGVDKIGFPQTQERHYATRADAPTAGELAWVLPGFVPEDATDITVRVRTTDPDAKMYDWSGGTAPDDCEVVDLVDVDAPFDPEAWPDGVPGDGTVGCGPDGSPLLYVDGDRTYAW